MQQIIILFSLVPKSDYYRYARPIASVSDAGNFDGNIAYQHWRTQPSDNSYSTHQAWKYTYDERNYLSLANYGSFNFDVAIQRNSFVKSSANNYAVYGAYDSGATPAVMPLSGGESFAGIAYDANGNLLNLKRNGENGELIDQFLYDYVPGTNRLNFIRDGAGEVIPGLDYKGSSTKAYDYNAIGQLTENIVDGHYITYDVYGKTQQIYTDASHTSLLAEYTYDDRGFRVKKFDNQTQATTLYVRDASGNIITTYTRDGAASNIQRAEVPVYGSGRLGMATCNTTGEINSYTYELTDQLGNVRATVGKSAADNTSQLLSATDYYPGGMALPGRNFRSNAAYRFGYQGQFAEKDEETGYNAFELRLYDCRIGRWLSTDPYNQYYSPYLSMGNNPVNRFDPDGGFDWHRDKSGDLVADPGDTPLTLMDYVNNNGGKMNFEQAWDMFYNGTNGNWLSDMSSNVYIPFKNMNSFDSHFTAMNLNWLAGDVRKSMNNAGEIIAKTAMYIAAAYYAPVAFSAELAANLYFNNGDFLASVNDINIVNMVDRTGLTGSIINVSGEGGIQISNVDQAVSNIAVNAAFGFRGKALGGLMRKSDVPQLLIQKAEFIGTYSSVSVSNSIHK